MKYIGILLIALCLVLLGCSSSEESAEKQETAPPPSPQVEKAPPKVEAAAAPKVDTVSVEMQNTQKPPYESKPAPVVSPGIRPPAALTGKFAVQVGAYKMPDNADRVAALARERFGRNVTSVFDKVDNLYKVMVGDFLTKDEARRFRDTMAERYPSDYKDAWVSELQEK
jgi:cell division septation protein DedD